MTFELWMLDLLHFEDVCALWVFQVLLYILFIIYLKMLKTSSELLLQLVW